MPKNLIYFFILLTPIILNAGNSRVTLFASQQATDDARQGEKRIFEIGTCRSTTKK